MLKILSTDTSMVASVLDEFTAQKTGIYPFRDIKLFDDVPEGLTLVWYPFSSDVGAKIEYFTASDIDAVFLDSSDNAIISVPKDRIIGVNAYVEEGITYAPVIAAEKDSGNISNNGSGPGDSGGGCNTMCSAAILAVLLFMKKRL